jgi:hypothetical protein
MVSLYVWDLFRYLRSWREPQRLLNLFTHFKAIRKDRPNNNNVLTVRSVEGCVEIDTVARLARQDFVAHLLYLPYPSHRRRCELAQHISLATSQAAAY